MAPELFGPGERRGPAQAFIRQGVEAGLSGRAILESLQEAGLGYRRADFYEDFRQWSGVKAYETPIRELRDDTVMPEGYIQESPFKLKDKYLYLIEATYQDDKTGEETSVTWGLLESERLSKDEILDFSAVFQEDSPAEGEVSFVGASVFQAFKRSKEG